MNTPRARIQVFVVVGIVLLLAGLLVSAVGRVRQEAARVTCANNLKQLGIAVHGFVDANGQSPPLVDQGEGSRTSRGLPSLFWELIPFLESTWRLYSPDRPDRSTVERYHAHSSTVFTFQAKMDTRTQAGGDVNQVWRTFLCPSDTTADKLRDVPMTLPDGSTGHYATGSYAANGMLAWNQKGRAVPSANTILFAERPQVCRTASGDTIHNLWGVGFYSPQMPAFATRTPADPPGLWSTGQVLPDSSDIATPVQRLQHGSPCDPRLPGSLHPGGMNAVMGDSSVRVFRFNVPPAVFWAACVPE